MRSNLHTILASAAVAAALMAAPASAQMPLDTSFKYQGELRLNNVVVNQPADFQFGVFGVALGGAALGTDNKSNVPVARGVFNVDLDFGASVFDGDKRWLEIRVRTPAGAGGFTTLLPRVELKATPYALKSLQSDKADDADALGGSGPGAYVLKGEANSVTTVMIAPGSVGSAELANNAVSSSKIADNTITSADIGANAVTSSELASNSVTSAKILDNTVTAADIAANAVGSSELASSSVGSANIIDNTVTAADIASSAVGSSELAGNSVNSSKIVDGSVTAADLAAGAIDGGNADTVDGLEASQFLRSDANDFILGGTAYNISGGTSSSLTFGGANLELNLGDSSADKVIFNGSNIELREGTAMTVKDFNADFNTAMTLSGDAGDLFTLTLAGKKADAVIINGLAAFQENVVTINASGAKRIRYENGSGGLETNFSYEPNGGHFTTGGKDLQLGSIRAGTVWAGGGGGIFAAPAFNLFGINSTPGSTAINSSADVMISGDLEVAGNAYLGENEGDSRVYFFDQGSATSNYIQWDDSTTLTYNGGLDAAFNWNIADDIKTAWLFRNGGDIEAGIYTDGKLKIDGNLVTGSGCDLAEAFFADSDLEAGTLVALDTSNTEFVRATRSSYSQMMFGVVSTLPGLLLEGPGAQAFDLYRDKIEVEEQLNADSTDENLRARYSQIEQAIDSLPRGNVPVALAGRVPVKVVGAVTVGEPLTSSNVPGHAMAMDRPGPSIGIAMESKAGEGSGMVLVLVQSGYREPLRDERDVKREDVTGVSGVDAAKSRRKSERDPLTRIEDRIRRLETRQVERERREGRESTDRRSETIERRRRADSDADSRERGSAIEEPVVVRLTRESWGDFDADGLEDVLVQNPGGQSHLYRNLGDGSFENVTRSANLGDTMGTKIALWEDYDQDRRLDLLLVNAVGVAVLYQGAGNGTFTNMTEALGLDFGQPIVEAEWLDYDHDGRPDLRVEIEDGTLILHHNQGQGSFRRIELRSAADIDATVAPTREVESLRAENEEMKERLAALEKMVEGLAGARGEER